MNFAKPYEDLREFIAALDEHGKLYRINREINKDSELQPLVRWQFRGGIAEDARRGFLFDNVIDGKKRKYDCRVLVGGLSGSEAIYCLGLKCQPNEVADRWIYAMDHLIEPVLVPQVLARRRFTRAPNCSPKAAYWNLPCRCRRRVSTMDPTSPPGIGLPKIRRPANATSATTAV